MVTLVGTGRVSKGVSHAHAAYPKGAGKNFLGPSIETCPRMHSTRTVTEFCMVIRLHYMKFFTGSTTPPALTKNLCDAHADGRSVCGGYPSCIFCFC